MRIQQQQQQQAPQQLQLLVVIAFINGHHLDPLHSKKL
jgi:hypothetical protein